MLQKNKDYVEFTLQFATVDRARSKDHPEICLNGYSDFNFPGVPMDVVCKEFNTKVVVVGKRDFERLQADDQHYRELAKQREENYNLLLKKTGFDTVESLVYYLNDIIQCDTMLEVVSSYISERDKAAEAFEKETNVYSRALKEWKESTDCPSPSAAKSLLKHYCDENKKLQKKIEELRDDISGRSTVIEHYKRDIEKWQKVTGCLRPEDITPGCMGFLGEVEKLAWVTEQTCCGRDLRDALQADLEYYRALSSSQAKSIYGWKEATGCDTPEMAKEAIKEWKAVTGCQTPDKARDLIAEMMNNKETTIYLGDTHNVIARWQKVTGYDKPQDFLKWKANIEEIMQAWKDRTGCKYPGEAGELLEKWKVMTKCETPEEAATWITSYESACERGNKLAEKVKEWEAATGSINPERAKQYINRLKGRLNKIRIHAVDW